jgi:hypothetical protein
MSKSCSMNGGEEEHIYVISGRARRKKPLGRPRCRWVDNIKNGSWSDRMGWYGLDWFGSG